MSCLVLFLFCLVLSWLEALVEAMLEALVEVRLKRRLKLRLKRRLKLCLKHSCHSRLKVMINSPSAVTVIFLSTRPQKAFRDSGVSSAYISVKL